MEHRPVNHYVPSFDLLCRLVMLEYSFQDQFTVKLRSTDVDTKVTRFTGILKI